MAQADEKVNIVVKIDAKTRELRRVITELSALKKMERRFASGRTIENYAQSGASSIANMAKKWKRSFDEIDAAVKMTGKFLSKFLSLAIKGVIVEMGLLSIAMVGVHALFVSGRFLMKAYHGAMQFLAGGAAAAAIAIGTVAAAIREQQAAMFAYRGKGAKEFGSGMNQVRMAMRNMQSDMALAGLGVESLNKAFGIMSKTMNMAQINASNKSIKALMDFGSAGQDPAKAVEQVATVISALSDQKKSISDVMTEAKKLGPEMEKALKEANIKTKDQFKTLLLSGDLAKRGGVSGQFEAINNTLIGQLKTYFGVLRSEFADFGDIFLEPMKVAFDDIFHVIRRDLQRISTAIQYSFGADRAVGGFVGAIEKTSNWMVRMIREYLPRAQGMFDRIGDWFFNFRRGWNLLLDRLRPLIDGARVLYKAWDPIWEAIKRGADNLTLFRGLLLKNSDDMKEFGERVAGIIDSISNLFMGLKKMFADMAPFINDVLAGVKQIFDMISRLLTLNAGGGLASALAPLFAFSIGGRALASVKGRLMPGMENLSTKQMNVNAQTVVVGGPVGPAGAALSSGKAQAMASAGRSAAVSGSPTAKNLTASQLASAGASAKVSGFPKEFSLPKNNIVGPRTTFGEAISIGYNRPTETGAAERTAERIAKYQKRLDTRLAYIGPGLGSRIGESLTNAINRGKASQAGIEAGTGSYAAGLGMTPFERDGMGAQDFAYGAKPSMSYGRAFINSMRMAGAESRYMMMAGLDRAQLFARRAVGAGREGMNYLRQPAFNPETGEYMNIGAERANIRQRLGERLEGRGRFMRGAARLNAFRQNLRVERNMTRFGAANQRFGKSFGGRMGTAMGLGMASQFAPEETRGAMALGATVSQLDPRLGIAVAGLGGAMTARGGLKGAAFGAAGGAMLGAQIGGPYGALAGAVIGGVFGAIKGSINKGAYEMQKAREAAQSSLDSLYAGIATTAAANFDKNRKIIESGGRVLGKGQFEGLGKSLAAGRNKIADFAMAQKAAGAQTNVDVVRALYANRKSLGLTISESQLNDMTKNEAAAANALETYGINARKKRNNAADTTRLVQDQAWGRTKQFTEQNSELIRIDETNSKRIAYLSRLSGKSGAELDYLAKTVGFDLYDASIKTEDAVKALSLGMVRSADEMNNALADVILGASDIFRVRRERNEAAATINQASRGLSDQLRSGGLNAEEQTAAVEGYFETFGQNALAATGGDAGKALMMTLKSFGAGPNAGAFAEGEEFAGLYNQVAPSANEFISELKRGAGKQYAGQLQSLLASKGFTVDLGQAERSIAGMSNKDLERFINLADRGALFTGSTYTGQQMQTALGSIGLGSLTAVETPKSDLDAIATEVAKLDGATTELTKAIETYNKYTKEFFESRMDDKPEWWSKEAMKEIMGDTSTPRGDTTSSRLSQTMARHDEMNSQLTGKRSITSAYRTVGLGSINSDHVMGRAYDLVGQNLGSYQRLVHANGGFAEFHGTLANRHLHVVPGAGMGDSTTPVASMGAPSSGNGRAGTNIYYNIEVNGATQSPEAIANMVMAKIAAKERNNTERM